MKQGRKPTRTEKEILSKKNLLWKEWEVLESNEDFFRIRSKRYGTIKTIWK